MFLLVFGYKNFFSLALLLCVRLYQTSICVRLLPFKIELFHSCSSLHQSFPLDRSANILSAVGISTTAGAVPNAVPVSISSIMYTDFLTGGPATDVTGTWVGQVSFYFPLLSFEFTP